MLSAVVACSGMGAIVAPAYADQTWINGAGGDWNVGSNWSGGAVPGNSDSAFLTYTDGSYTVNYSAAMADTYFLDLTVSNTGGNTTTLNISAPGFVQGGPSTANATIGQNATVNVNAGGAWVQASPALLTVRDGGSLNFDGGSYLSYSGGGVIIGNESAGSATVKNGGSLLKGDGFGLQVGASAGGVGTLTVESGGVVSVNQLFVGGGTGESSGTVNVTGGTLEHIGPTGYGQFAIGNSSNGAINVSGGVATNNTTLNIGINAGVTGTLAVSGTGSWSQSSTMNVGVSGIGVVSISGGSFSATNSVTPVTATVGATSGDSLSYIAKTGGVVTFDTLVINTNGYLVSGDNEVWTVTGSFRNSSEQASLFDVSGAEFVFSGGSNHSFGVSGLDLAATSAGYVDNFALGALSLDSTSDILTLIDERTIGGALYLTALLLPDDDIAYLANIISGGMNIYYDSNDARNAYLNGETYALTGGGFLTAVPEPGTYALLGVGLLGVVLARLRSRSSLV